MEFKCVLCKKSSSHEEWDKQTRLTFNINIDYDLEPIMEYHGREGWVHTCPHCKQDIDSELITNDETPEWIKTLNNIEVFSELEMLEERINYLFDISEREYKETRSIIKREILKRMS